MENNFPDFEIIDEKTMLDIPEGAFGPKSADVPITEGDGKEPQRVDSDPTLQTKAPEQKFSNADRRKAFGIEEEDEDEDENEGLPPEEKKKTPEKKGQSADDPTFKVLHEAFVKQGLLDKDEEFDGSEDGFVQSFVKREEKTKENLYKQMAEELGDEGLSLIRHLRNGGAVEDFVQTFSDPLKNVNLENEAHQKAVIRNYYERQGWEDADIEQELKDIEDLGEDKLKDKATKFYGKLQAAQTAEKENFAKEQEAQEIARKNEYKKFTEEVGSIIDSNKEIMGIPIGRTGQPLKDYIFKPAVRLDNGQLVSKYVADRVKNANNKQLYVLNAMLMMNGYRLPEASEAAATTKATLGIKKQLETARKQTTIPGKISNEDNDRTTESKGSLNWESLFDQPK